MAFIGNPVTPASETDISNFSDFWPAIKPADVRSILRLNSDITLPRLTALIQDAMCDVNTQLSEFTDANTAAGLTFADISPEKQHQYRRAIYATAQAQLISDLRDYDTTASGTDKTEALQGAIDVQRRVAALAIRAIQSKSTSHIELI